MLSTWHPGKTKLENTQHQIHIIKKIFIYRERDRAGMTQETCGACSLLSSCCFTFSLSSTNTCAFSANTFLVSCSKPFKLLTFFYRVMKQHMSSQPKLGNTPTRPRKCKINIKMQHCFWTYLSYKKIKRKRKKKNFFLFKFQSSRVVGLYGFLT